MKNNNGAIIILLIFIWLVGFVSVVIGLTNADVIIPILGISAPYYLTKYLLIESDNNVEE